MRQSIKKILEEDILTTKELAKILGVSPGVIRQRIHHDKYQAVRHEDVWLLDADDFRIGRDRRGETITGNGFTGQE